MSNHSIVVDRVTKRYGDFTAVEDVTFNVTEGTIFGLLGPNGAGKTTTIRMIMNITIPDSGTITILGQPSTEGSFRRIGYLPEERGLYKKMKVLDHVVFLGEIRGLPLKHARVKGGEWLDRLGLSEWKLKKVEELSKGMQQKIQFIGAVIHEPPVLILDEPFSGLDPVNALVLKELFLEYRAKGRTLVFSTHVMEQAEKLCDEIALINQAHVVLNGPLSSIKKTYSGNRLRVAGRGDAVSLRSLPGVGAVTTTNGSTEVELVDGMTASEFIRGAAPLYEIDSVVPHEASLDEIFIKVVGESDLTMQDRFAGGAR